MLAVIGERNLPVAGKAAILFAMPLTVFAMTGLSAVLPEIEKHFRATPGAGPLVRSLVTAIAFTMIFGAPLAGLLGDRFGRKRVLVIAISTYAVIGTAGLIISNLWLLLATRLVLGFATAATGTLLITLATTAFEGTERDQWLGWMMTTSTASALILVPVAGMLGKIGWRIPFALHLIALPLLVLVIVGVPADAAQTAHERTNSTPRVQTRFPWVLVLTALSAGIVCSSANLFLPFHLRDIDVGDPAQISMALLPSMMAGTIAAVLFGRIRRCMSILTVFLASFLVGGAGMVALGAAQTIEAVIVAQIAVGACGGLIAPNMFGMAATMSAAQHRARNIGVVKGLFAGGPFFGQLLLEPIAQITSAGGAIFALGVASLFAGGLCLALRSRKLPT